MLTLLTTVKTRLGIDDFDVQSDSILTNAIRGVSARFDRECGRNLSRTVNAVQEFSGDATEIWPACYPIESVTKFELKSAESSGWVEQSGVEFLLRRNCVLSLETRLGTQRDQARVTYTGGFVLPGTTAAAGQTPLPDDLEQAAVEQVAFWFQNRDKLGLVRIWPHQGTYEQFAQLDLMPTVKAVLQRHERWVG
jgi:hypothetical protein